MSAERESRMVLEPDPASVRASRRFLQSALDGWGVDHLQDVATLLVSEVVTNVVLHARTPAELVLRLRGERLRVEVHDASPALPQLKVYGPAATTGRGMGLIAALSSDHGTERTAAGKAVWFELEGSLDVDAAPAVDSFFEAGIDDLDGLELALSGGQPEDRSPRPDGEVQARSDVPVGAR